MASLVKRVFTLRSGLSSGSSILMNTSRSIVYSESGSILQKPTRVRFGVIKVLLVVLPSIYVGGIISRTGAHLLEEHDIFVPESDDDDD